MSLLSLRPGQVGGAETYVRRLTDCLPGAAEGDQLALVLPRHVAQSWPAPGWSRVVVDAGDSTLIAARMAEAFTPFRARAVEQRIAAFAPDAVLFPQQSIFPKSVAAPAVLTVHDLQHLFFPQNFAFFDRAFRAAVYPRSLRTASRIISISAWTKKTLVERAGVPADKITAVGFGVATPQGALPRRLDGLPDSYLYTPAATFPHKNHATLFRSYAALRRRGALAEPLLLTGLRTRLWPGLERLIRDLGMQPHIRHLGYLDHEDVGRVYAGASAVLFPTLFEGFGLPVIEAAAFGKKVIVSRLEVFDEIGVPAAFQIDFADPDQLLAALRLSGPTALEKTPATWEEIARATMAELRRAAGEGAPRTD